MASPEHLAVLARGVDEWNAWRARIGGGSPDLSEADFSGAEFNGVHFFDTDLRGAVLNGTRLERAEMRRCRLAGADLTGAQLHRAVLQDADLRGANLSGSVLTRSYLMGANLSRAILSGAQIFQTSLTQVEVQAADFSGAALASAGLVETDLSQALGLDDVFHVRPSDVGAGTLRRSKGGIPDAFLKGCGLQDWEIASAKLYDPDLSNEEIIDIQNEVFRLRADNPLQIGSLFISYSHRNEPFVEAVESRLDDRGIRYWRDKHEIKAGRVERQIDRGLRLSPTVLLVLSEDSVESDWVRWEAAKAREFEKQLKRDVLCPVTLDASWKKCRWPGPLRQQIEDYHILDFSDWEDEEAMDRQFARLLDGLALFYERREA